MKRKRLHLTLSAKQSSSVYTQNPFHGGVSQPPPPPTPPPTIKVKAYRAKTPRKRVRKPKRQKVVEMKGGDEVGEGGDVEGEDDDDDEDDEGDDDDDGEEGEEAAVVEDNSSDDNDGDDDDEDDDVESPMDAFVALVHDRLQSLWSFEQAWPTLDTQIEKIRADIAQWSAKLRANDKQRSHLIRQVVSAQHEIKRLIADRDKRKRHEQSLEFASTAEPILRLYVENLKQNAAMADANVATTDIRTVSSQTHGGGDSTSGTTLADLARQSLLRLLDPNQLRTVFLQRDVCQFCHVNMLKHDNDAQLVCPKCHVTERFMNSTSDTLTYGEEIEMQEHDYEGEKHFEKFCSQFREGSPLPPSWVIQAVDQHFRKKHERSKHKVKPTPVRKLLKKIAPAYYPQSQLVCNILNGLPIPRFNDAEYYDFVSRFREMKEPTMLLKRRGRKNNFSFGVLINLFATMSNRPWFVCCFPRLKITRKQKNIESQVEKVCAMLNARRRHPNEREWFVNRDPVFTNRLIG